MRIISFIILLLSITINCIALEVILNPYKDIDYEQITVYDLNRYEDACSCDCYDF